MTFHTDVYDADEMQVRKQYTYIFLVNKRIEISVEANSDDEAWYIITTKYPPPNKIVLSDAYDFTF